LSASLAFQKSGNHKLSLRIASRWQEDTPASVLMALEDDLISEIMVNQNGDVLTETIGGQINKIAEISPQQAEGFANLIASLMGASVSSENAVLEGELPGYPARVAILVPPVVPAPTISIRKKAIAIYTLADYETTNALSLEQKLILQGWICQRKNILVVGGTASGKTTFMNGLVAEVSQLTPHHRLVVLEDTVELQCQATNVVQMRSSDAVPLQALVKTTLRHRPDRIIVGEVRGKEVFDLLTAWSTGHPGGLASLHANSAKGAFTRLEQLLEIAVQSPMRGLIGEALDAIVHIEKTPSGRKIQELVLVHEWDGSRYQTETVA
jgi:P-type conjugative transfer ATPase TrbB